MSSLKYRADIDGLRAVAVASVVLFHAFPGQTLSGGFTGVDVFFVISGYLITRIIAEEMSRNSFSLLSFYERRIKRIIPALVAVLLASLAVGWFVLQPGDYRSMAESAIYAAFSFSNVFFLNHTGYFDAAAHTMPLLHTWSLGVEEQFYIVWPALLGAAFWLSRRFKLSILWLLLPFAGLALWYSVWLTGSDSKSAFYLSTSRAYELLIGALVAVGIVPQALLRRPLVAHSASLVGAGLIICGFLVLDAGRPFPGLNGLLPTVGAALVISGGLGTPGIINRFLAYPAIRIPGQNFVLTIPLALACSRLFRALCREPADGPGIGSPRRPFCHFGYTQLLVGRAASPRVDQNPHLPIRRIRSLRRGHRDPRFCHCYDRRRPDQNSYRRARIVQP